MTGNTISGNTNNGAEIDGSTNVAVTGNKVGTNTAGDTAVPNGQSGISMCNTSDSTIGGSTAADRNILSGNAQAGITLNCSSEENNVLGNYIGRAADGTASIPNTSAGIQLSSNSDRNVIGGKASGAGNLIAGNAGQGITVDSGSQSNAIWGNSITDNGGLGIDLNSDTAVNPNDNGDTDGGGNNLQNFPVLTQAGSDGSVTIVKGSLNSRPSRDFRLEFFANSACDASGNGEGARYLGTSTVTTDGSGNATFTSTLPSAVVGAGEQVTATATDVRREDTSEFSACTAAIGLPSASINDVTVTEGDSGTQNATFTITLSAPPTVPASVRATTAFGTAGSNDFSAQNKVVSFGVGETSKTFTVPIKSDLADEFDETYTVNLTEADNMTISDGQGLGTITDNDPPPTLIVSDVVISEPTTGTAPANVVLTLSAVSGKPITVKFATANGTATSSDYVPRNLSTVTFNPGTTTRTLPVNVKADTFDEPDQNFFMNFSAPVNVSLPDTQSQITIQDTDPTPAMSINDPTITEGNSGTKNLTFTITLTNPSDSTITADYATADGTAVAPGDYAAKTGSVSFAPGSTTRTVNISIKGDTAVEPDENFLVNLSNPANATISDGSGQGTIQNDD